MASMMLPLMMMMSWANERALRVASLAALTAAVAELHWRASEKESVSAPALRAVRDRSTADSSWDDARRQLEIDIIIMRMEETAGRPSANELPVRPNGLAPSKGRPKD
jgi:hypothetical protein